MRIDNEADSQKAEWQKNLFLLGLIAFIALIIFGLSALSDKSTSPRVTESAEQHLQRQPHPLQNLYNITQGLFVEYLPPLEKIYVNYVYHKYFELEFIIAPEQLTQDAFQRQILPRFLAEHWQITEQNTEKIVLDHATYGRCTLMYPQATTAWQIRFYLSYLNNVPTADIQPVPITDPQGISSS